MSAFRDALRGPYYIRRIRRDAGRLPPASPPTLAEEVATFRRLYAMPVSRRRTHLGEVLPQTPLAAAGYRAHQTETVTEWFSATGRRVARFERDRTGRVAKRILRSPIAGTLIAGALGGGLGKLVSRAGFAARLGASVATLGLGAKTVSVLSYAIPAALAKGEGVRGLVRSISYATAFLAGFAGAVRVFPRFTSANLIEAGRTASLHGRSAPRYQVRGLFHTYMRRWAQATLLNNPD